MFATALLGLPVAHARRRRLSGSLQPPPPRRHCAVAIAPSYSPTVLHVAVLLTEATRTGAVVALAHLWLLEGALALRLILSIVAPSVAARYGLDDASLDEVLGLGALEVLKELDAQRVVVVQAFEDFTISTEFDYRPKLY